MADPHPSRPLPPYGLDAGIDTATYHAWLTRNEESWRVEDRDRCARLASMEGVPTISIVMPVHRPLIAHLQEAIQSVTEQSWSGWELCICDDASGEVATSKVLSALEALADPRVRVVRLPENVGISGATNAAAHLARGEFLAFLDQDDILEPTVVGAVAERLVAQPSTDVLYTDQDILAPEGQRIEPYLKSGWNPDLLLSNMYMGHLLVVRTALFRRLGGLRSTLDGAQDYDLVLRATDEAREVAHLATVGYHWRRTAGSTAASYDEKPYADRSALAALASASERRGDDASVEAGQLRSSFRYRRPVPADSTVRIVVPLDDDPVDVVACVTAVLASDTGSVRTEIVLWDRTTATTPETHAVVRRLGDGIAGVDRAANLPQASASASPRLQLFLDPSVRPASDGWLEAMAEHALRQPVGAVGARLVTADGTLVHAGVVPGVVGRRLGPVFLGCPATNDGYWGLTRMVRNWTAVSGRCLLTSASTLEDAGGWGGSRSFALEGVDFCERLRALGRLVVFTPYAEMTLDGEDVVTTAPDGPDDVEAMTNARADPYFNRNLDPAAVEFRLPPA